MSRAPLRSAGTAVALLAAYDALRPGEEEGRSKAAAALGGNEPQDFSAYWMAKQGEHGWLEEVLGDRALGWVKDRNRLTLEALGDPASKALYRRLLGILESREKIPHVRLIGDLVYNFWQDAANPRGLWRRCTYESYTYASSSSSDEAGARQKLEWETVTPPHPSMLPILPSS